MIKRLPNDQLGIWTSPFHLKPKDALWLIPGAVATGLLIHHDRYIYDRLQLSGGPKHAQTLSDGGVVALAGLSATMYGIGLLTDSPRAHETGLLSFEAGINSYAVTSLLKLGFGRNRPETVDAGKFFSGGNSFPSEHATLAWSMASVIAHEYRNPLAQITAYGLASAVSLSRIPAQKHFPSDVLVGSALGWATGKYIYSKHHDRALDENIGDFITESEDAKWQAPSVYVPADDEAYPIFARLAAMGYIQTEHLGMQPWTRLECARLTDEANSYMGEFVGSNDDSAQLLLDYLKSRFSHEGSVRPDISLDSIYFRTTVISGDPLRDSYHFGQTIAYDYGRPYWAGTNIYTGLTAHADAGPLVFYVRGEYQHAPAMPAYSPPVEQLIASVDVNPVVPSGHAEENDFRLMEAYVGTSWRALRFTAGKQVLRWGPTDGAFLYSTNAEPIYMFRSTWEQPLQLPGVLGYLGKISTDFFFGKLSGHHFPPDPYVHGQKITLKLTPNLEFGFSRTTVMGGAGHPLTIRSFGRSLFSTTSSTDPNSLLPRNDPGDRRGGFDFRYRVPGLRNWLTLYSDSMVDDDVSPLSAPRRAAFNPGIYLPKIPGANKLDLRLEAAYTDFPTHASTNGQFMYFNSMYHDAYTNKGQILGNVVGREGKTVQGRSTYWFSPEKRISLYFRHAKIAKDFIPGGGTQFVGGAAGQLDLTPAWTLEGNIQGEQHLVPALEAGRNHSVTTTVQLTWRPGPHAHLSLDKK